MSSINYSFLENLSTTLVTYEECIPLNKTGSLCVLISIYLRCVTVIVKGIISPADVCFNLVSIYKRKINQLLV